MNTRIACLFVVLVAVFCQLAPAFARNAFVVRVESGNMLAVSEWPNLQKVDAMVQMYGIGTPTLDQPFGKEAQIYVQRLIPRGAVVDITVVEEAKGGNLETSLVQVNGGSLNYLLVKEGLAWVDRQNCKAAYCRRWFIEEHKAVVAKKGIWSIENSTPPWQWAR